MAGVYSLSFIFGYFMIMLIFMVLGIICAKNVMGWIFYGIGAVLQLVSMIGNTINARNSFYYGASGPSPLYWIIYVIILIVVACIIGYRRSKY